ncbi:MAG: hypothetical protein JWN40_1070 [Phycisphaerales bacterium]|nr:hypothetical protein [Phycisphaerales bacterium]
MKWPDPQVVWKAIEVYVEVAYGGPPPPSAVRSRLETLRALSDESFYDSAVFEHRGEGMTARVLLRLGNRFYPHMKLAIERRPDRQGCLFRADTHDAHCCPSSESREYEAFRQLMEMNQTVAQSIDAAWERAKLPTFKTYLREDLARRQAMLK